METKANNTENNDTRSRQVAKLRTLRRRHVAVSILGILVLAWGVVEAGCLFFDYKRTETSNDAQIEQYISPVNLRASGYIKKIYFTEHQQVRKGDTLYSISRAYNVDMNSLAKANHIKAPYTLSLGQTLVMPGTLVPATSQSSKKAVQATKTAAVRKTPAQSSTKTTKKTASKPVTLPKAPSRSGRFSWPVSGTVISNFGPSGGGRHNDGINIKASRGTPFKAAENGVVAYAGNELKGFGNLLLIKHADGFVTAYAHADSLSVKRGQTVKKGQTLGKVGSTGNVNAPQLHFEIRKGTKAINPRTYLSQ